MAYIKKGLVDDGSSNLSVAGSVVVTGAMTVAGTTTASSPISASAGLSGSLQQVGPGLSYLVNGTGMTVTSASNGQITLGINNNTVATVSGTTFSGPVTASLGMQFDGYPLLTSRASYPSRSQYLTMESVDDAAVTHQWFMNTETYTTRSYVMIWQNKPTTHSAPLWLESPSSALANWGFFTSNMNIIDINDQIFISMNGSAGVKLGFYGKAPVARPTVTGSIGGNTALEGLLNALVQLGLITSTAS